MTKQDALTRLAAANPVPDAGVRGAADSSRAVLLVRAVLARPRPRRTLFARGFLRGRRMRYALPAGLAAAAATAAAAIVVVNGILPSPAPVPQPPDQRLAAPQTILSAAADQAEHEGRHGQFVHATGTVGRVVHRTSAGGYDVILVDSVQGVHPADGRPGEGWLTFGEAGSSVRPLTAADAAAYRADGSPSAQEIRRGDAEPALYPNLAGDQAFEGDVAGLPDDPAETGTAMIDWVAGRDGFEVNGARSPVPADPQGWLFREGTKLLDTFTDVVSGAQRAKIYRMLAGLTGVRTLDATADPLGRPALGLSYTERTPRYGTVDWQVFLGDGTDRIMFHQAVVRLPGPANASLTPGTVQYSTAITSVTWSDKP